MSNAAADAEEALARAEVMERQFGWAEIVGPHGSMRPAEFRAYVEAGKAHDADRT